MEVMHENESLHTTLLLFQFQPIIDLLARVTFEKRIIPQIKLYIKYNYFSSNLLHIHYHVLSLKNRVTLFFIRRMQHSKMWCIRLFSSKKLSMRGCFLVKKTLPSTSPLSDSIIPLNRSKLFALL